MWYFLNSVKSTDVVESIDGGGETTVKAEDLVIDEGSEWKVVKEVGEVLPDVCISVFSETLVIEAVDLGDLSGFVVSTEDGDAARVTDFQGYEEGDGLNRVVSTIDIVAHKQIVCVWVRTSNSEQLHQIVKLTMYISTNCDRAFHWLYIRLILQYLSCLFAQSLYVDLCQLLASHQAFNPTIQS